MVRVRCLIGFASSPLFASSRATARGRPDPTPAIPPASVSCLAERWLSGRKHRTRNAACPRGYPGFESLPLRHAPRELFSPVALHRQPSQNRDQFRVNRSLDHHFLRPVLIALTLSKSAPSLLLFTGRSFSDGCGGSVAGRGGSPFLSGSRIISFSTSRLCGRSESGSRAMITLLLRHVEHQEQFSGSTGTAARAGRTRRRRRCARQSSILASTQANSAYQCSGTTSDSSSHSSA